MNEYESLFYQVYTNINQRRVSYYRKGDSVSIAIFKELDDILTTMSCLKYDMEKSKTTWRC